MKKLIATLGFAAILVACPTLVSANEAEAAAKAKDQNLEVAKDESAVKDKAPSKAEGKHDKKKAKKAKKHKHHAKKEAHADADAAKHEGKAEEKKDAKPEAKAEEKKDAKPEAKAEEKKEAAPAAY